MSRSDMVLSDFIDAWNAGRRPSVRDYLDRVPAAERDDLADRIGTWLEVAPAPVLGDEVRATIRADPAVARAIAAVGDDVGAWPEVLPGLRARAGLGLSQLAGRLVEHLGLGGRDEAARATAYLERMEQGSLGADRVSRRLLDALGGLLGVSGSSLADLGGRGVGPLGSRIAASMLFRADDDAAEQMARDIDVLSRAAMAPAPAPMDELDVLFCGGPDA
jgi:hypothetical protein